MVTSHCALHRRERSPHTCVPIVHQQMGGTLGDAWSKIQGDMHMVAARLDCERAMAGTGWACSHPIAAWTGLETLPLTCRGFISGEEGCLDSERVHARVREC